MLDCMGLEATVWAELGYKAVNYVSVRVQGLRVAGSKLSESSPCAPREFLFVLRYF